MATLMKHKKRSKRRARAAGAPPPPSHFRIRVFNRPDPAAPGHPLTYLVIKNGKPDGDGRSIKVDSNDTVRWRSPHGAVVILFKNETPLDDVSYHASANIDTAEGTVQPQPAPDLTFEYFVALAVSGAPAGAAPVIDDPDMIVT
jgi:hypothetical protein